MRNLVSWIKSDAITGNTCGANLAWWLQSQPVNSNYFLSSEDKNHRKDRQREGKTLNDPSVKKKKKGLLLDRESIYLVVFKGIRSPTSVSGKYRDAEWGVRRCQKYIYRISCTSHQKMFTCTQIHLLNNINNKTNYIGRSLLINKWKIIFHSRMWPCFPPPPPPRTQELMLETG